MPFTAQIPPQGGLCRTEQAVQFSIQIGTQKVAGRLWRRRVRAPKSRLCRAIQLFRAGRRRRGNRGYELRLPNGRIEVVPTTARAFRLLRRWREVLPLLGRQPDVIHCNDWQTGLVPV